MFCFFGAPWTVLPPKCRCCRTKMNVEKQIGLNSALPCLSAQKTKRWKSIWATFLQPVHPRPLFRFPLPHERLQWLHSPQASQLESTEWISVCFKLGMEALLISLPNKKHRSFHPRGNCQSKSRSVWFSGLPFSIRFEFYLLGHPIPSAYLDSFSLGNPSVDSLPQGSPPQPLCSSIPLPSQWQEF